MGRYLSVRSRGGSAENAPNGMKRTMGGAKKKALLGARFSND
jgi:hypothetical protein